MKKLFLLIALLIALAPVAWAETFVNLTPAPAAMTVNEGLTRLPREFKIGVEKSLPAEMKAEADKFAGYLDRTIGYSAKVKTGKGFINVALDSAIAPEGYRLDVTDRGVDIAASSPAGLFYAFQTLKKIMPVNVMAGTPGLPNQVYMIPRVSIADEPKYEYRGFMLDVSRHFFNADQIKKMLDLMAIYKLNRFHWHLTDDQGWRLPVRKYPELTRSGATNRNILRTDFSEQRQWRAGNDSIYGPYAYTTDEIRDIIAYAKDRHIEVIPEIDMPGHMVAAIHAYPYLSTDPESALVSKASENKRFNDFSHEIWNKGGVSWDVLDVSNPRVLEFVCDVIDEVAELFPYEYIHIGGDECDLIAWENSESCKSKLAELGLGNNYRALQSWFTKQVADYAREKHGRKVMGWNEIITSGNVDMEMIKSIDPVIFCWIGGEKKAQNNGLRHIYTPFNGGYYINRSYKGHDKVGAVGDGALVTAYRVNPPAHDLCVGVQGTFWTEQVDRGEDLEYLALPRLIAIAEQGWSPDCVRGYDDFLKRMRADAALLDAAGYNYGKHQIYK